MNSYLKKTIGIFFIGFLTFGIGNIVLLYIFSDKAVTDANGKVIMPMREMTLNLITLGIYGAFWTYKMGKKADILEGRPNISPLTVVCSVLSVLLLRSISMSVIYYRMNANEGFDI